MTPLLQYKDDCLDMLARHAADTMRVHEDFFDLYAEDIQSVAKLLALAFCREQHVYFLGDGLAAPGAAILASRFLGELGDRPALPAFLLTKSSAVACSGTEEAVPAPIRQLEAFGSDGDILVLFSADGQSPLLCEAARTANEQGMLNIGITGGDGGSLAGDDLLDLELRVPSIENTLVMETQTTLVNILTELTNYYLYTKPEILRELLREGISDLKDELAGE